METQTATKEYRVDAKDKKLGRLASEIAILLMGKDSLDFARNKVADIKVKISNASLVDISVKKMSEKKYKSYSGYPGGLKFKSAEEIIKVHGYGGLIKMTVRGMLPTNKLRDRMLKNLIVEE